MKHTAGQVLAKALKAYGVPLVAGLPGHGNWTLLDAFNEPDCELPFVQVMHEQSAVHLADAFYRVTGQPVATTTSIGPGAMNTVIGLATAYADSTATVLITGSPATHMRYHGVMQELDRQDGPDFPSVVAPVTKRRFEVGSADDVPFVMHRAFNAMLSGRPGPVVVEMPMDVQTQQTDLNVADLAMRLPVGRPRADADAIGRAVSLLLSAERPVIVAGGGAVMSDASRLLTELAQRLGIPVAYTWNGKGAIPDDHARCAGTVGWPGSSSGNYLCATADVVLAVGCKFTDWSSGSYRAGDSYSIPPGRLIQIDVDAQEIGKNYATEVGIVADCRSALEDILASLDGSDETRALSRREHYLAEVMQRRAEWEQRLEGRRSSDASPMTMLRVLRELRAVLPRDGIVTVGSGHPQSTTKQSFPIYEPRTHITSGSFSPMGFAVPAAIGCKLAKPETPVVAIVGDGDFMQTAQELAVCAMNDIPVVFLVLNNKGYISIRDGQKGLMGRQIGAEFNNRKGEPYSVDFAAYARSFGIDQASTVSRPDELAAALQRAVASGEPALVEADITRDSAIGASDVVGWWDFPVLPSAPDSLKQAYATGLALEQHR